MNPIRHRFLIALIASLLLCSSVFLHADGTSADGVRHQSLLSAGVSWRRLTLSDVITTWLEHAACAPSWDLRYRLRSSFESGHRLELLAGFSYFESNTFEENGRVLDEGEMRVLVLEAPIGVESAIPLLGPFELAGAIELVPVYREYGRVVSESGAVESSDFSLSANGRWGVGVGLFGCLRTVLSTELSAGAPLWGETSTPSGEADRYDPWTLGLGGSAAVELVRGPLFVRLNVRYSRAAEFRFLELAEITTAEGTFRGDLRTGIEAGVRW